jgi:hypothetical protein
VPYRNHAFAISRSNYGVNSNVDFAILDRQLLCHEALSVPLSACCAAMRFGVNIANRLARDEDVEKMIDHTSCGPSGGPLLWSMPLGHTYATP